MNLQSFKRDARFAPILLTALLTIQCGGAGVSPSHDVGARKEHGKQANRSRGLKPPISLSRANSRKSSSHGYARLGNEVRRLYRARVMKLVAGAGEDLRFAIGKRSASPATLNVEIASDRGATLLKKRLAVDRPGRWEEQSLDLDPYAGASIAVRFRRGLGLLQSAPLVISRDPAVAKPAVVLAVIDTLRADSLGCYGSPSQTTPFVDRFSRQSTLYQETRSTCSWTLPSVASIMTGKLPHQIGAASVLPLIASGEHLASRIEQIGWPAFGVTANPCLSLQSGILDGFRRFLMLPGFQSEATKVTAAAFALLQQNLGHRIFLYLHYIDPHAPYRLSDGTIVSLKPLRALARQTGSLASVPDSDRRRYREAYAADIRQLDWGIAPLLRFVLATGSSLFLTADHGDEFFEHGGFAHGRSLYHELIRVPLLVEAGSGGSARLEAQPVSLKELPQAILSRAEGKRASFKTAGFSLAETSFVDPLSGKTIRLRSAVSGSRKVIFDVNSTAATSFDLETDPLELEPEKTLDSDPMVKRLTGWREVRVERSAADQAKVEDDLRQLGYLP